MWRTALLGLLLLGACGKVGDRMPEFRAHDLGGRLWDNTDLEDRIVVINVWATWCGPCIAEIAQLNRLEAKYGDRVLFLAFTDEPASVMQTVLQRYPFHYVQFSDAGDLIDRLKRRWVKTYPQNLVVGRMGRIVFEETEGKGDIYGRLDRVIAQELTK